MLMLSMVFNFAAFGISANFAGDPGRNVNFDGITANFAESGNRAIFDSTICLIFGNQNGTEFKIGELFVAQIDLRDAQIGELLVAQPRGLDAGGK
mmetsp:Transcript_36537/g.66072  ORF Transcript_36537/g.66072 Transcript_36537/m.66072 type:complete len:95 (-) Transcript_36537:144-428(-)